MFLLICSFSFLGKENGILGGFSSFTWSWKSLCSALVSRSHVGRVDICPSEHWIYFYLTLILSVSADVCLLLLLTLWFVFFFPPSNEQFVFKVFLCVFIFFF